MRNLPNHPIDVILTVHYQNLVNTYGEEAVKAFFNNIIFKQKQTSIFKRKKVSK
jgi:hypothetical protein